MRKIKTSKTFLLIAGCIVIAACSKSPPPAPETTPTPVPSPRPTPVAIVTPTPPLKHLAPDGDYFVLQRIPITTDSGVIGIQPGTKVALIKMTGTGMTVTDGSEQFDVMTYQVTNDLDLASHVLPADKAIQADLSAIRAQQEKKALEKQRLEDIPMQRALINSQLDRLREAWSLLPNKNPKASSDAEAIYQEQQTLNQQLLELKEQEILIKLNSR